MQTGTFTMNTTSPQNNDLRSANPIQPRMPRWAVVALVLQSLTLLCVFATNAPNPAVAGQFAQPRDNTPTIPNAAAQRAEQTKLLARVVAELEKTNSHLGAIDKDPPAWPTSTKCG